MPVKWHQGLCLGEADIDCTSDVLCASAKLFFYPLLFTVLVQCIIAQRQNTYGRLLQFQMCFEHASRPTAIIYHMAVSTDVAKTGVERV